MSTDPCLDAALAYIRKDRAVVVSRPSLLKRIWCWYKMVTGYERAILQRKTGLRIRSTCHAATAPRRHDLIDQIVGGAR